LNDRNTKEQLTTAEPEDSSRGSLEGVGLASTASQSQKNCTDVMTKHLKEWMDKHEIKGPPPSADAEQRAIWEWIRDFHKEYNDDWFSRNMPRLHETFRPIFVDEIKRMKKQVSQNATQQTQKHNKNLMDFEEPEVAVSQVTNGKGTPAQADLLSLEEPTVKAASGVTPTPVLPANTGAPGTTTHTGSDLLDLDFGTPSDSPKDALGAGGAKDSNLLDLM
jgi:hypothetical protein